MPDNTILLVLAIAVGLNLFALAIILGRPLARRIARRLGSSGGASPDPADRGVDEDDLLDRLPANQDLPGHHGYDRAIRVASWGFLMATAGIAAGSGLWPTMLPAVVVLVAITGLLTLVAQEVLPALLPAATSGRWGWRLGAVVALGFGTGLTILTGGAQSPFFMVFPLIAGGTALAAGWRSTLLVTVGAVVGYTVAIFVGGVPSELERAQALVNLIALSLLAFIGAVVRAETRRIREAVLRISSIDSLTGLYNRSFFFAALEREISRSDRSGRGFCLVMLDVDDLKATNDLSGHHAGDGLLRSVADTVRTGIRKSDVAARYAGDEFVALLPETDPGGGWIWAEKIRVGVAEQHVPGSQTSPTVSVGVVSYPQDGTTADALMISADRAMYISKRGGKNRVAWATSEPRALPREGAQARTTERDEERPAERPVQRPMDRASEDSAERPRWPGHPVGPGPSSTSGAGTGAAQTQAERAKDLGWPWEAKGPGERAV